MNIFCYPLATGFQAHQECLTGQHFLKCANGRWTCECVHVHVSFLMHTYTAGEAHMLCTEQSDPPDPQKDGGDHDQGGQQL